MWEASGVGVGPPVFPDIMTLGGPAPTPDASQSPKSICLSPNHPPLFGPFLDGGTQIQFHRHDDSFILCIITLRMCHHVWEHLVAIQVSSISDW